MTVTILDTLDAEDLDAWRETLAREYVARSHAPDISADERARAFRREYEHAAELFERYEIRGEEAVQARISPYTGAIFIGEGE